ncbi:Hypothetical protein Lpl7_0312 [Lacticaseibacillus paracasei subsp. tolerans Lpl7]|nr:Hypothetical protein Lpl7_0312 [Lacticaseibacillus paracasei subsp. tolerans Lpl7]
MDLILLDLKKAACRSCSMRNPQTAYCLINYFALLLSPSTASTISSMESAFLSAATCCS